jgi:acetoacetyl-CoA reductase/3-oxoacyl-[acyl-carrier protein] reductase
MSGDHNRIVLVTGGSRGIGHGIARRFLQDGFSVAVGYCQHPEGAEKLVREFPKALPVQINLEERKSIRSALIGIREHFQAEVRILVNNGAIAQEKPFLTITDEDWDRMLKINLAGPFALTQEVLPAMIAAGWGRIVNISSIGGQW